MTQHFYTNIDNYKSARNGMLNPKAIGIHHISVCIEALLMNISNADFINYIPYRISNYRTEYKIKIRKCGLVSQFRL